MCLSPVTIVSPSRFVSLSSNNQILLQVPCNHCAECQRARSNEWHLRSYLEFQECLSSSSLNGFVQFDTLTYHPKYLHHISEFVDIDKSLDFSCFNSHDLRQFTNSLSQLLRRKGVDMRYFISSEYGSINKTFRPHYHALFFVRGDISPVEFSNLVGRYWKYGRTDGSPYKSDNYVINHNTVMTRNKETILRVCNYVTKYVQKSTSYQRLLDSRVQLVMDSLSMRYGDILSSDSLTYKLIKESIVRHVNQFHRQSHGFGASLLRDIDLNDLMNSGCVYMPSSDSVKIPIPIPMYYKRKLFYDVVKVDGVRYWSLNDDGKTFHYRQRAKLVDFTSRKLQSLVYQYNITNVDCLKLSDYIHNIRGRLKYGKLEYNVLDSISEVDYYGYINRYDHEFFRSRGYTTQYLGNQRNNYRSRKLPISLTIRKMLAVHTVVDDNLEAAMSLIYSIVSPRNRLKQKAFDLKQRLNQLAKFHLT